MAWVPDAALGTSQRSCGQSPRSGKQPNEEERGISKIGSDILSPQSESATQGTESRVPTTRRVTATSANDTDEKVKRSYHLVTGKVAEAEDLPNRTRRPPLLRRASLPDIRRLHGEDTKEIAMRKKDGKIWKCIDWIPDKYGGHICKFRIRGKYAADKESMDQKLKVMFPALEPIPYDVLKFNKDITKEEFFQCEAERKVEHLKQSLDYFFDVDFPDYQELPQDSDELYNKMQANFINHLTEKKYPSKCVDVIEKAMYEVNNLDEYKRKLNVMLPILANPKNFSDSDIKYINSVENAEFFNELGYSSYKDSEEHYVLTLPDRQALLARWGLKMEKNPDLPELDIASGSGIAGDMEFVEAYLSRDLLLSSGEEFLHDQMFHVTRLISLIFSGPYNKRGEMYKNEKSRLSKLLGKAYQQIMLVEQNNCKVDEHNTVSKKDLVYMKKTLGGLTDTLWAQDTYIKTSKLKEGNMKNMVHDILIQKEWKDYWERHFPGEVLDIDHLCDVWDKIWNFAIKKRKTRGQA